MQKREVEYDKYQRDKLSTAKIEFRSLLKETKLITYKSCELVKESVRHYKDIIDVLKVREKMLNIPCVVCGGEQDAAFLLLERQAFPGA